MKVVWTNHAKEGLRGIFDYLSQDSPQYAQAMVDRITRKTEPLAKFSRMGNKVGEFDDDSIRK